MTIDEGLKPEGVKSLPIVTPFSLPIVTPLVA